MLHETVLVYNLGRGWACNNRKDYLHPDWKENCKCIQQIPIRLIYKEYYHVKIGNWIWKLSSRIANDPMVSGCNWTACVGHYWACVACLCCASVRRLCGKLWPCCAVSGEAVDEWDVHWTLKPNKTSEIDKTRSKLIGLSSNFIMIVINVQREYTIRSNEAVWLHFMKINIFVRWSIRF